MAEIYSGISLTESLIYKYRNIDCINLYYIYNKYSNIDTITFETLLSDQEINKIVETNYFNTSISLLFDTFINIDFVNIDFNKILHVYIALFGIFGHFNKRKDCNNSFMFIELHVTNYSNLQNKLIVRPGVVELRACSTDNYNLMVETLNTLSSNISNESYIINTSKKTLNNWLSITHNKHNYDSIISSLMTNAGFYISNTSNDSVENFLFFKKQYTDAIMNADYIMFWPFVNCYSLNILNNKKKLKDTKYIDLVALKNLVAIFDNKRILLLTPFKTLIDIQYNSKNLYKLRKTDNLSNIKLDTIEAFVTTYPNRKHNNFIETYTYYIQEIDKMFSKNTYDIFTCSCGCYGLLLCDYVHKTYNVTCVYIGNSINAFFGISFGPQENDEYYLKSDINVRYRLMENIENNLYGYKN
jgi:hypothetical protein